MSTISDALRKVQKSRPDDTHGSAARPSLDVPLQREKALSSSPVPEASGSRLTVVIVGVLVVCLIVFLMLIRTPAPTPASTPALSPLSVTGETNRAGEGIVAPEPVAEKASLPPPGPLPVLSGTFYSTQNPVAIINGSSLKEGETVGAYQVIKILPRSVILKSSAGDIELRLQ
jgi:hypothetical protein